SIQDPGYQSVLGEVATHIGSFAEKLGEYSDLLAREQQLREQLKARADQVTARVEQINTDIDGAMQAELKQNALLIVVSSLLALLVGIVAAWLITRAIVGPLRQVIQRAQRIAAGDLREEPGVVRNDEVGQLMQAMQQMGNGLSGIVSGLQAGIEQLASNAHSLSAVTEQ
ncbi:MAG: HAMP domain-containing protein, partial [Pseudomonas sp.]